jgi:hypothetical protein
MCHRSSELQEHIEILGGNLVLFYQQRDAQPRLWKDDYDLDRFAVPDSLMNSDDDDLSELQDAPPIDGSEHTSSYLEYLVQTPDAQNPPVVQFSRTSVGAEYDDQKDSESEEESIEISCDDTLAETDLIVKKYAEKAEPPEHSYPTCFLQIVPAAALKALYYTSSLHPDRNHIIELFNVPPAIQTVMTYARYENTFDGFDRSCWPGLERIHPSIRKALYLGSARCSQPSVIFVRSSFEISTLAGHFGVPLHVDEIEDIESPLAGGRKKLSDPHSVIFLTSL